MPKCASCEYAVFDEQFGEYKCRIRQLRVYKPPMDICEWYKKGTPTETKEERDGE
jgi:hypothetical protein